MNKTLLSAATLLAASALAAPASATVHMNFVPGSSVASLSGYSVINAFETDTGIVGSDYIIHAAASDGQGALIPTSTPNDTNYLAVLMGGIASIALPNGTSAFAFDWGSLDWYNDLQINLLGGAVYHAVPGATFTNTDANGNQTVASTNGLFMVYGDAGEVFTGITLRSGGNSFEIDNLVTQVNVPAVAPVPEPSTWAMMIAGVCLVGTAMRRRKVAVAFA